MKEKRFLTNFTMIFLVLLAVVIILVGVAYFMSVDALENEIQNIYQNSIYDLQVRLEDVLQQCNFMTSYIVNDDTVQLYYSHAAPDSLLESYYSTIYTKLNSHAIPYIDSIILYSPKYDRMISNSSNKSYQMSEVLQDYPVLDVSWLDNVDSMGDRETMVIARAKNNTWPYYFSLIKKWSRGGVEGVVILNVSLAKLYDHLISSNSLLSEVYIVNNQDQVILEPEKTLLMVPVGDIPKLSLYEDGISFSRVQDREGKHYVYAQAYSKLYGLTSITVTQVNDHYNQIKDVQQTIMFVFVCAFLVTFVIAVIYTYRLDKPLKDIRRLMDSPLTMDHDNTQYDESIQDIAEQLFGHLQTNNRLREELDSRLGILNDTKILALQAQINPHFLFNTMNAIRLTVENDCGNDHPGLLMLDELSYVLRYSLSDINVVPIMEELKFIKEYISIMNHRYGEIETSIEADPETYKYLIPKLVFQPLVENSIQHGLAPCIGMQNTKVIIRVSKIQYRYPNGVEQPSVCIEIEDNGIGMGDAALDRLRASISDHSNISREHIGLTNVSHRFYLMFHNEQDIQLESKPDKGTKVTIVFRANEMEVK